jgi:hypothetical protein
LIEILTQKHACKSILYILRTFPKQIDIIYIPQPVPSQKPGRPVGEKKKKKKKQWLLPILMRKNTAKHLKNRPQNPKIT